MTSLDGLSCQSWPEVLQALSAKAASEGHLNALKKTSGIQATINRVEHVVGVRCVNAMK